VGITLRDFIASCYLPKRLVHPIHFAAIMSLLLLAALAGCRRGPSETTHAAGSPALQRLRANLALVPAEARIVLGLDLERLRATPLGQRLVAGSVKQAVPWFAAFAQGTGIDLLEQVRQVVVAVPGERQGDDRFVLVAESARIDEARVTAWLRQRPQQGHKIFVHGANRLVVAQGAWADRVAAPSGASAAEDPELRRLCERAAGNHVAWLAAIVPAELRRNLADSSRFADVVAVARLSGAVDVEGSLRAEAVAELSNESDAASLAHRLGAYLTAAKHHPDMLAQGLAPYLEALRLAPRGPHLRATLELGAAQADDLVARIEEFARAGWAIDRKPAQHHYQAAEDPK